MDLSEHDLNLILHPERRDPEREQRRIARLKRLSEGEQPALQEKTAEIFLRRDRAEAKRVSSSAFPNRLTRSWP